MTFSSFAFKKTPLIVLIVFSFICYSQETFKTRYIITKKVGDVELMMDVSKLDELNPEQLEKVKGDYNLIVKNGSMTVRQENNGHFFDMEYQNLSIEEFYKLREYSFSKSYELNWSKSGFVKFEKNRVYANLWLAEKNDKYKRKPLGYYELKDRQSIRLKFCEGTISALVIPIKYRYGYDTESVKVSEEYSAEFNLNGFIGLSRGNTKFLHRKKVGNKVNTKKVTLGVFGGTVLTELNSSNTSASDDQLDDGVSYNQGAVSYGFGLMFSYNKFTVGGFYGWDNTIGEKGKIWNYNGRPWLGFGIGYDIFKI